MKLINPLKINKSVNFYILIILITRCIACIFFMAMLGTILGRLIVFSKTQVLFFDWRTDIIYSLKVGGGWYVSRDWYLDKSKVTRKKRR